ncbi:hypothetical protein PAHAL_3G067000 [Panicum hallii]|jgi:hypothetical protein|uniref:Uncharacterized protein n=1 Tax=Panicum hallii TaxID=206008 RepID=A0A2S3H6Q0_9POAL|nr:hypothetical protein PAHAL_3G067000 [Panicum hallii]
MRSEQGRGGWRRKKIVYGPDLVWAGMSGDARWAYSPPNSRSTRHAHSQRAWAGPTGRTPPRHPQPNRSHSAICGGRRHASGSATGPPVGPGRRSLKRRRRCRYHACAALRRAAPPTRTAPPEPAPACQCARCHRRHSHGPAAARTTTHGQPRVPSGVPLPPPNPRQ